AVDGDIISGLPTGCSCCCRLTPVSCSRPPVSCPLIPVHLADADLRLAFEELNPLLLARSDNEQVLLSLVEAVFPTDAAGSLQPLVRVGIAALDRRNTRRLQFELLARQLHHAGIGRDRRAAEVTQHLL